MNQTYDELLDKIEKCGRLKRDNLQLEEEVRLCFNKFNSESFLKLTFFLFFKIEQEKTNQMEDKINRVRQDLELIKLENSKLIKKMENCD